jgi:hypothetical protein
MTTFFEHQRTSYKRNYLKNLISLASLDGNFDDNEKALIHSIGIKRGLKGWQIDALLLETGKHEFFLPESVANRMNLLYDVMQIVYADSEVNERELEFVTNIVAIFKLQPDVVNDLITFFQAGTPDAGEWKAFVASIAHVGKPEEMVA